MPTARAAHLDVVRLPHSGARKVETNAGVEIDSCRTILPLWETGSARTLVPVGLRAADHDATGGATIFDASRTYDLGPGLDRPYATARARGVRRRRVRQRRRSLDLG